MSLLDRLFRRLRGCTVAPATAAKLFQGESCDDEVDDVFLSRLRRAALVSQRRLTSGLTGEHTSPRKANALEFADYRNYAPGDDLRRVDWNAYLRLNQLFVKLADAPERLTLHILLDGSRSMAWGNPEKFRYARRVAIGLAYIALAHMDAANLLALMGRNCLRLSQLSSPSATATMIRTLGSLIPSGTTELDAALASFSALGNHRGVAVLISDLFSPTGYRQGLERLSRSALRPVVIHVLSPEEVHPALEGDLELEDVETGDTIQVSIDWGTLRRYQRWLQEWLGEVESFCARRGITYIRAETSESIEELLLDRLRREKVLR